MSTKKKNKKKSASKKKKKKKTVNRNRIITSQGINIPIKPQKKKKKFKIPNIKDVKEKLKKIKFPRPNIDKEKLKEQATNICKKAKIIISKVYSKTKYLAVITFKYLKELVIKLYNITKKCLIYLGKKLYILLLLLCKVTLILIKNIKNRLRKQYNISREQKLYKKEIKKIKVERIKIDKQQKNNQTIQINIDDDEQNLLRYKDYQGFAKITVFFINRIKVIKFDMKKFNKKFKYGTLKDKILILLMLMLIAGFSCIIAFCVYIVATAPEISNERLYKSSASVFLNRNGEEFARRGTENREKVTYDELPEVLIDAIVSAEDSRFFQHNGVDVARFTKAVIGQLMGRNDAGGGSTLTMQVSKNAATSNKATGFAGIKRKFQDIYLAVFVFEKNYTKDQIMEFYVNIPYLGSGTYGVQQAAKTYFDKEAKDLTLVEAATIAGLFQSPDAYDPLQHPKSAENRRNTVLNLMCRHGYITEEERDNAKAIPLSSTLAKISSEFNKYQDFIDTVSAEVYNRFGLNPATTSMVIYTTMDPAQQDVVNGIMNGETYKWANEKAQAGIAVVKVEDGSLTAVGASRSKDQLAYNYATMPEVKRHPGSTAKPILDYGPAIEYLNWGSGTTVIDDAFTYTGGGQIKNFDNGFKGIMTAKTALAQSRNIPALYTFQQTTNEQKLEFASNVNWHPEDKNGYINESASIGGFNGVSPLQAAAAYATFARGGTYIEPYSFTKIELADTGEVMTVKPKKVQAMSESTAYIINMILKYAVTSGSVGAGSVSGTDLCAKTGTSTVDSAAKKAAGISGNVIGDSWEVAYSPDFAIATWYGYDEQLHPIYHLTSTEGGNARKKLTQYLTSHLIPKNSRFEKPSSVVQVEIELGTDPVKLASPYTPDNLKSVEYFKKGYEPQEVSDRFAKLQSPSNLTYTTNGSQIVLNWSEAKTPTQANHEALREYFSNNVYKNWTEKYLQERINYNNSVFGNFGYQVFMITPNGTTDLGFTTNTTFTINAIANENTTFMVKSSYQNYKYNQSDGITAKVQTSTPNTPPATQEQTSWGIEFNHSCVTVDTYNNLGPSPQDKIRVTSNGQNVTDKANISAICYNANGDKVNCNELASGNKYTIDFTVVYSGQTRKKSITIQPSCN